MSQPIPINIVCFKCNHEWQEDLSKLDAAGTTIYKGLPDTSDFETYRVVCPNCNTVNMIEIHKGNRRG